MRLPSFRSARLSLQCAAPHQARSSRFASPSVWVVSVALAGLPLTHGPTAYAQDGAAPRISAVAGTNDTGLDIQAKRARIIEIAEAYATFEWTAEPRHVRHGADADGVQVDTPDRDFTKNGFTTDGAKNIGIPYQWGGFSSFEQFDAGLKAGMYAGHLPKGKSAGDSKHAVGVDCSGLVARAWDLPAKESTRSLGRLCYELDAYSALLPGDILNRYDAHVMIFKEFVDGNPEQIRVIEAATPRVQERVHSAASLQRSGYLPLRYRPLDDRWVAHSLRFDDPDFLAPDGKPSHLWTPAEETPNLRSELTFLDRSIAEAHPGDWVRYRVIELDENGDRMEGSTPGEITRGLVDRGSERVIQVKNVEGGRQSESQEPFDATQPFLDAVFARLSPESRIKNLNITDPTTQSGEYVIGDSTFTAIHIQAEMTFDLPSGRQSYPTKVQIDGYWSSDVPLGGFLRLSFHLELFDRNGVLIQSLDARNDLTAFHGQLGASKR